MEKYKEKYTHEIEIEMGVEILEELGFNNKKYKTKEKLMKKNLSDVRDKYKNTPLHHAVMNQNNAIGIIKYLVNNKSDLKSVNNEKNTALHLACKNKNLSEEIVKYLIEKKSDLNSRDKSNNTPLHLACRNKSITAEIIENLLKNKSEFHIDREEMNYTLHAACRNKNISLEIIKCLVENNCELNSTDKYDNTPLHKACFNKNVSLKVIKFLVESKSDLSSLDDTGSTPLHVACNKKKVSQEIIKFLIERKTNLNVEDSYGDTCFDLYFNQPENLSKEVIIAFIFAGYHIDLYEISNRFPEYKNFFIWNFDRNKYLPLKIQQQIQSFIICSKYFSKNSKQIFPKPISFLIIQCLVDSFINANIQKNFSKKRKRNSEEFCI